MKKSFCLIAWLTLCVVSLQAMNRPSVHEKIFGEDCACGDQCPCCQDREAIARRKRLPVGEPCNCLVTGICVCPGECLCK
jgi:hypothetical protein